MAWILVRATPGLDAYAAWSSVTDQFFWFGTLDEARAELDEINDERYFERARDAGCSTTHRLRDWTFADRAHSSGWHTSLGGDRIRLPADRLAAYIADVLEGADPDEALARHGEPDPMD